MTRSDWITLVGSLLFIVGICLLVLSTSVLAWPYVLNVTNGNMVLTDLNSSNNMTFNFTLYVYNYNNTFNNFTNITTYLNVTNVTCFNCTNYYNETYTSNYTGYNRTEQDLKFLPIVDFNNYRNGLNLGNYALKSDIDSLTIRIENVTASQNDTPADNVWLWVVSIAALIIAVFGIIAVIVNRE